jgi:hypothetical protein
MQLTLTGIASDDLAIAEFVAALRRRGGFHAVELRSSADARPPSRHSGGDVTAREYTVECVLGGEERR